MSNGVVNTREVARRDPWGGLHFASSAEIEAEDRAHRRRAKVHAGHVREWEDAGYRQCEGCGVYVHPRCGVRCPEPEKRADCPTFGKEEATPCRG